MYLRYRHRFFVFYITFFKILLMLLSVRRSVSQSVCLSFFDVRYRTVQYERTATFTLQSSFILHLPCSFVPANIPDRFFFLLSFVPCPSSSISAISIGDRCCVCVFVCTLKKSKERQRLYMAYRITASSITDTHTHASLTLLFQ